MASTLELLTRLNEAKVEFVIVGGVACVLHGCSLVTEDLDVCVPFNRSNMQAIIDALDGLHPRWRTTPVRPPFSETADHLASYKNIYLDTDLGILDILAEIAGLGGYGDVLKHVINTTIERIECRVLDLDSLIRAKRALGRPRDLHAVRELEAVRQRLNQNPP